MKKVLLAAATVTVLATSPAFAESNACQFLSHSHGVGMNGRAAGSTSATAGRMKNKRPGMACQ